LSIRKAPAVREHVAVSSAAAGGVRRLRSTVGLCQRRALQPGRVPVRVQVQLQTTVSGTEGWICTVLGVRRKYVIVVTVFPYLFNFFFYVLRFLSRLIDYLSQ